VTGRLHLDDHNRIHRELDWAQIKNGVPNGVPTGVPAGL
jgi:outer membrane PBP1 activator LpoA protein